MAKQKSRFIIAPNTELLTVQYNLHRAYGTNYMDAILSSFCANGWKPVIPEKCSVKNLKKY
jgi:hypothetical protein